MERDTQIDVWFFRGMLYIRLLSPSAGRAPKKKMIKVLEKSIMNYRRSTVKINQNS